MNFAFSEEQSLLRDSLQKMLSDAYDFRSRQAIVATEEGWSREIWRDFAELGWLGAPFPEELGGLGGGPIETMIIMEQFGRHLVVEPFLETVVLAGKLLQDIGSEKQKRELLPEIFSGNAIWCLGWAEPQAGYDPGRIATRATRRGDGYTIQGSKAVVTAAPWADKFIITACTDDGNGAEQNGRVSLFIVDRHTPKLELRSYRTLDGRMAAEILLDNVNVDRDALLGNEGDALAPLERTIDHGMAALCAEAVGLMGELHQATVEYTKSRKQFGVPIGSFQALQHRMVDMYIAFQESKATTHRLHLLLERDDDDQAREAAGAKVKIGEAGRFIGQQAIQLHGAIGMTDELNVGHFFKRLTALNIQFGDPSYHLARYTRMLQLAADRIHLD